MRPKELQTIGDELAIKWEDDNESFIKLELLRRACPCAACKGEKDVFGNLHRMAETPLTPASTKLSRINWVGGYAVQPVWADGHSSGLFAFDLLKRIADGNVDTLT